MSIKIAMTILVTITSIRGCFRQIYKTAAVLVPVIGRDQEPTILLTKRSDDLNHHAGQGVSFPGGRHEESDLNMIDTALRETEERRLIGPRWLK